MWNWKMRPREEEKKERNIANHNEIHHIYVGIRHTKTVKQCRTG
jgi:hypothetical protein